MNTLDKTVINFKISKTLKQEAQELAEEIGIPLSTVVIANLKDFVRSRSLTVSALPRLKQIVEREIGEAITDYKNNTNISEKFTTTKGVTDYLKTL